MEITLLGIVLCVFLFFKVPLNVGSLYWLTFLFIVYLVSFPSGPVQQIKKRLRERPLAGTHRCSRCENDVNNQDLMCSQCKLELAYNAGRPTE